MRAGELVDWDAEGWTFRCCARERSLREENWSRVRWPCVIESARGGGTGDLSGHWKIGRTVYLLNEDVRVVSAVEQLGALA